MAGMKQTPLSRFELLAQRLVEDGFGRLFGGRLEPLELANRLARVLEDSQAAGEAANALRLALNPEDYAVITEGRPGLEQELSAYVGRMAQQAGLALPQPPVVTLRPDGALRRRQVRITAERLGETADPTTTQVFARADAVGERPALAAIQALDAFLIVEGRRHVLLDRPLITLGRRMDNDIVLDAPTVSRRHAQIRWRFGHFVLYDLSDRGRTRVNDQPAQEVVLRPGDVIGLSDVLLIYGEGRDEMFRAAEADEEGETLLKSVLKKKEPGE
jgi:hypothetical protein